MHPLRHALKDGLLGGTIDNRGWPVCEQAGLIKLALSKTSQCDGLSVVEALFDVLQAAGYAPRSDTNGLSPAYVEVLGVRLRFELLERSRRRFELQTGGDAPGTRRVSQHVNYTYSPTGCFELAVMQRGATKPVFVVRTRNSARLREELPWLVLRLPEFARSACPATTPPPIRANC
jgi:hypothetical protein